MACLHIGQVLTRGRVAHTQLAGFLLLHFSTIFGNFLSDSYNLLARVASSSSLVFSSTLIELISSSLALTHPTPSSEYFRRFWLSLQFLCQITKKKKFVQENIFPSLYLQYIYKSNIKWQLYGWFCEIIDFLTQFESLAFFEEFGSVHFKFALKFTGEYTFIGHNYFEITFLGILSRK